MDPLARLKILSIHMDTKEDVNEFESLLAPYFGQTDKKSLTELINLFHNECPYYEVMWGLIHLVETWPKETYVKTVIQLLPQTLEHASFWMDCLCSAMFNNEPYYDIFKDNVRNADKNALMTLFDIMEKESPHHAVLIQELRDILNK